MTDKARRADRWRAFYEEDGGLRDLIASMRQAYFERHASLGLSDTDKHYALSMADKIASEIEQHFKRVIDTGVLDEHRSHARRIEALPAARRRFW